MTQKYIKQLRRVLLDADGDLRDMMQVFNNLIVFIHRLTMEEKVVVAENLSDQETLVILDPLKGVKQL